MKKNTDKDEVPSEVKENDSNTNATSETYNNESTNETAPARDVKTLVNDLPDGASSASKTVVEDGEKVESMTFEILNQPSSMEDSYVEITSGEAANNAETVSTEAESVTEEASDHPEPEEESEEGDQRVNSVGEKIEVIDLVVNENEDKDDGVDDSDIICETDKNDSVIFCGSSDNRRITRASLKKDSEYDDDDEIVLLKEVEGTKKAAELLEESDFTDSDNDSSVVSVETEVTLDMDKNEAETVKQNGDAPSEDKSKNHSDTESDKLNESLKIDLRPSWQVKKTTFAKTKETTASI